MSACGLRRAEVGAGERGADGERGGRHQQPLLLPGRKLRDPTQSARHRKV